MHIASLKCSVVCSVVLLQNKMTSNSILTELYDIINEVTPITGMLSDCALWWSHLCVDSEIIQIPPLSQSEGILSSAQGLQQPQQPQQPVATTRFSVPPLQLNLLNNNNNNSQPHTPHSAFHFHYPVTPDSAQWSPSSYPFVVLSPQSTPSTPFSPPFSDDINSPYNLSPHTNYGVTSSGTRRVAFFFDVKHGAFFIICVKFFPPKNVSDRKFMSIISATVGRQFSNFSCYFDEEFYLGTKRKAEAENEAKQKRKYNSKTVRLEREKQELQNKLDEAEVKVSFYF